MKANHFLLKSILSTQSRCAHQQAYCQHDKQGALQCVPLAFVLFFTHRKTPSYVDFLTVWTVFLIFKRFRQTRFGDRPFAALPPQPENGCADRVETRLEPVEFPLKAYSGFRLPAGEYLALRVLIGKAEGQNWWCVVYPPLCMTAAANVRETGIACGMEREDLDLMQEEGEEYQVKFRCVELWEQLRQWLHK